MVNNSNGWRNFKFWEAVKGTIGIQSRSEYVHQSINFTKAESDRDTGGGVAYSDIQVCILISGLPRRNRTSLLILIPSHWLLLLYEARLGIGIIPSNWYS